MKTLFTFALLFLSLSVAAQHPTGPDGKVLDCQLIRPINEKTSKALRANPGQVRGYQLDLLSIDSLRKNTDTIKIAVIDTGVDTRHPDLAGRVIKQIDLTGDARGMHPHGTHVAGIIAALDNNTGMLGVAPTFFILDYRVLNSEGFGNSEEIALSIKQAVRDGADIINMSLGSTQNNKAIETAIKEAYGRNIPVIAAAGNEGPAGVGYPAALSETISVAAIGRDSAVAFFSSRGKSVDIAAPGVDIFSTVPGGYASYSGTSMASPVVAAIVGILMSSDKYKGNTALLYQNIKQTATDAGDPGKDDAYGFGIINPVAMMTTPPETSPIGKKTGIALFFCMILAFLRMLSGQKPPE